MGLGVSISVNGSSDTQLTEAIRMEIYERLGETTLFSIFYPADTTDGDIPNLIDSRLDPGSVLSINAGPDNGLQCLVKGPIYSHQIHLEHGGEGSTVEVKGADTSITMDREFQSVIWSDNTDSDAVNSILGDYGLTTDVTDTRASHSEDKHTLVQRESDLRFVRRLARRNGFYFWITCDASTSEETAHFKRPSLDDSPAVTLAINLQPPTIQVFDLSWNAENPTSVTGTQLNLNDKSDIDGDLAQTPQTILGKNKLLDITGDTRSVHVAAPVDDSGDMQARSEGALVEADWFIRASCRTSLNVLGQLVRAHTIATIKGAGSRHSGNYLVSGVRHKIDAADHIMEIELVRNGWDMSSSGGTGISNSIF
jgi:Phage tail baseplate hub (GPD)